MSIHDAVIYFNTGGLGTLLIFDDVGIERGYWTIKGCESENQVRLDTSRRKSTDAAKIRRRKLRAKRKGILVQNEQKEGKCMAMELLNRYSYLMKMIFILDFNLQFFNMV